MAVKLSSPFFELLRTQYFWGKWDGEERRVNLNQIAYFSFQEELEYDWSNLLPQGKIQQRWSLEIQCWIYHLKRLENGKLWITNHRNHLNLIEFCKRCQHEFSISSICPGSSCGSVLWDPGKVEKDGRRDESRTYSGIDWKRVRPSFSIR